MDKAGWLAGHTLTHTHEMKRSSSKSISINLLLIQKIIGGKKFPPVANIKHSGAESGNEAALIHLTNLIGTTCDKSHECRSVLFVHENGADKHIRRVVNRRHHIRASRRNLDRRILRHLSLHHLHRPHRHLRAQPEQNTCHNVEDVRPEPTTRLHVGLPHVFVEFLLCRRFIWCIVAVVSCIYECNRLNNTFKEACLALA
mmetsp:Transcript_12287/g.18574  ORF Transcript_12287/g.18574 Transcript_12287/m.18574 type:complete len:200 (+) Transcript_12287:171-770(+)